MITGKFKLYGFIFLLILASIVNTGCTQKKTEITDSRSQQVSVQTVPSPSPIQDIAAPGPTPTVIPVTPEPTLVPSKETDKAKSVESKENSGERSVLQGIVVCIDPGHQAKANNEQEPIAPNSTVTKEKMSYGTVGVATGIPEHKLNLAVSLKLREELEKRGAKVVMTRETENVNSGNIERAKLANASNAALVIRIHADGIDNGSVKGMSVLYPGNQYISDVNLLKDSKSAAEKVLNAMVKSTGVVNRGIVPRNDMTGFNWSSVPVILIEMGFMTNEAEDRLMNSPEYQNRIVEGMCRGIEAYFIEKAAGK